MIRTITTDRSIVIINVDKKMVIKTYNDSDYFEKEMESYIKLETLPNINIPKLIAFDKSINQTHFTYVGTSIDKLALGYRHTNSKTDVFTCWEIVGALDGVFQTLVEINNKGWVHGDVKSTNITVCMDDQHIETYLIDFDLFMTEYRNIEEFEQTYTVWPAEVKLLGKEHFDENEIMTIYNEYTTNNFFISNNPISHKYHESILGNLKYVAELPMNDRLRITLNKLDVYGLGIVLACVTPCRLIELKCGCLKSSNSDGLGLGLGLGQSLCKKHMDYLENLRRLAKAMCHPLITKRITIQEAYNIYCSSKVDSSP
jgi:serine/threonine protein kinase